MTVDKREQEGTTTTIMITQGNEQCRKRLQGGLSRRQRERGKRKIDEVELDA